MPRIYTIFVYVPWSFGEPESVIIAKIFHPPLKESAAEKAYFRVIVKITKEVISVRNLIQSKCQWVLCKPC